MSFQNVDMALASLARQSCVDGVTDGPCAHCVAVAAQGEVVACKEAALSIWERGFVESGPMRLLKSIIGDPEEPAPAEAP